MNNLFRKADKRGSLLRMIIQAPSGSGKTFTGIQMACTMFDKVAVLDTENGSAEKTVADFYDFDVLAIGPKSELEDENGREILRDYHPDNYVKVIEMAEQAGYDCLVIDSISHEWMGIGGMLELHKIATEKRRDKNSYAAWGDVIHLHNRFLETIISSNLHIIATVRSKTAYAMDKVNGRTQIQKVGMGAVTRDGVEYEFDILAEMTVDHKLHITKSRCADIADAFIDVTDLNKNALWLAEKIQNWLGDAPDDPYVFADGTRVSKNAAQRRLYNEYLAEYDKAPENVEVLKAFYSEQKEKQRKQLEEDYTEEDGQPSDD